MNIENWVRILRRRPLIWVLDALIRALLLMGQGVLWVVEKLARLRGRSVWGESSEGYRRYRHALKANALVWKALRRELQGRNGESFLAAVQAFVLLKTHSDQGFPTDWGLLEITALLSRVSVKLGNPGAVREEIIEALHTLDRLSDEFPQLCDALAGYRQRFEEHLRTCTTQEPA